MIELAPWQEWYIKHAFCKGRAVMLVGRKGPYITCTCLDKEGSVELEAVTNVLSIELSKELALPMSVIDGRPWVPTEDELSEGNPDEQQP